MTFEMPRIDKAADAATAASAVVEAVAAGELTPCEASEVMKIVDGYTRTLQASDFETRLERLEQEKGI